MSNSTYKARFSCEGKTRFTNRQAASQSCEVIYDRTGERMEVYKCEFCSHWHIGHPKKKKVRK